MVGLDPRLKFANNVFTLHINALILSVTHILDLDHTTLELLLTEDHSKGNGILLAMIHLIEELGLLLVQDLGLHSTRSKGKSCSNKATRGEGRKLPDLDAIAPQLGSDGNPVQSQIATSGTDKYVNFRHAELLSRLLGLVLKNGKDTLNTNAKSHTRNLPALGIKHSNQVVVSSSARHRANLLAYFNKRGRVSINSTRNSTRSQDEDVNREEQPHR